MGDFHLTRKSKRGKLLLSMSNPYRTVKIKQETYKAAKIRAAEMGMSLVDFFEYVVNKEDEIIDMPTGSAADFSSLRPHRPQ